MKTVTFFAFCLALSLVLASTASTETAPEISDVGICVVEFNAAFNSANSVPWVENISDCEHQRIDIAAQPELQKKHKIVVVPTIIVFNDGEEDSRFQANIMMQMEATEDEVQEAVDEIILNSF